MSCGNHQETFVVQKCFVSTLYLIASIIVDLFIGMAQG